MPQADVIRVAREFAENAEKTRGKSMIFLGAGTNHWYHSDMIYRTIIGLTTLCGCQGVNGGGWAHYVGQEKVRPQAAWSQVAFGARLAPAAPPAKRDLLLSTSPPINGATTTSVPEAILVAFAQRRQLPEHMADYNVIAARLGWLPSYPQFNQKPDRTGQEAVATGRPRMQIIRLCRRQAQSGDLQFAVEDPDNPAKLPARAVSVAGQSAGGQRQRARVFPQTLCWALKMPSSTQTARLRPEEIEWRDQAPEGKLDLLVTLELRMSTSAMYADIALPAAGWYEMHDLNTTDMHPFIHPFNPAIDPLWESRTNWEQFKTIAAKFSELAADHLGEAKGPCCHTAAA